MVTIIEYDNFLATCLTLLEEWHAQVASGNLTQQNRDNLHDRSFLVSML